MPTPSEQRQRNRADLKMPRGLTPEGKKAYEVIRQFLTRKHLTYTGGCKAFYKPADWDKKEKPKLGVEGAVLVVVFDGGELARVFNSAYDCPELLVDVNEDLHKAGFWIEPITHWWLLVYPKKKGKECSNETVATVTAAGCR